MFTFNLLEGGGGGFYGPQVKLQKMNKKISASFPGRADLKTGIYYGLSSISIGKAC